MTGLAVHEGTAREFHSRRLEVGGQIQIHQFRLVAPALVLGSTQAADLVDEAACSEAGVDVVRRRSGGGAVLLMPHDVVWLDVLIPRGGPGWADDIHAPMVWLGEHLLHVLESSTAPTALTVHRGGLIATRWSREVCFDGVGAGEVMAGDSKVVGISQRRTRSLARLQCLWYTRHDHSDLLALLRQPRPRADQLRVVTPVSAELSAAAPQMLADRFSR